jgi:hypothetical protein
MQVSDIVRRVTNIFGDKDQVQIDQDMILDWINDGQKDICRKAECLEDIYTAGIIAGNLSFIYPQYFLKELTVKVAGIKLSRLTYQSFNVLYPDWEADQGRGNPLYYYHYQGSIWVWPRPAVDDVDGFQMYYIRYAPPLIDDNSSPMIPEVFHEDLVEYCLWRALQQDEQWVPAREKKAEYESRLLETIYDSKNLQAESYPAVRLCPGD